MKKLIVKVVLWIEKDLLNFLSLFILVPLIALVSPAFLAFWIWEKATQWAHEQREEC